MTDASKTRRQNPPPRLVGRGLRTAARLMESRVTGPLLFQVTARQIGVDQIRRAEIPLEVTPYLPAHLLVPRKGQAPQGEDDA